jgi:hypothetical protein
MSAPTFVYRATVVQYAPTDGPDYLWQNTHEFTAPGGLLNNTELTRTIALAFRNFHRSLLLQTYGVDRVVVSTYGPDLPFPPGFAVFPFRAPGTSTAAGRPLPLEVVAFIRKRVNRGRNGKMFLRGVLTSNMLRAEEFTAEAGANFPSAFEAAGNGLIFALNSAGCELVLASGPVATVQTRTVVQLEAANARSLKYRTRRKTRLQVNAVQTLRDVYRTGGGITIDEIPVVVEALRNLLGGANFPQLPSP